jgi:hypothetical protein
MTTFWPLIAPGTYDYNAGVWGAGIGVSLNDPGNGDAKRAYSGPIKGFNVAISGTLNGQVLRLNYTDRDGDDCAPFFSIGALGATAAPFVGKTACPTWSCAFGCMGPTSAPYDLQVMVVGGDTAGQFHICIDSITPIL